ncbi:MAG TPA: hypothetical protein PK482_02950 [Spirochaetota bacterium]|nr:hypothetical protein [Spirochaetota bacterium]
MKLYNVSIFSLFIILFSLNNFQCTKKKVFEELEPNNTFTTATPLEINQSCQGTLATDDDIDNYIIRPREDLIVKIELSPVKGVNHAFDIWEINSGVPKLYKSVDDNRKSSPEMIANLFVTSGDYIITVRHGELDAKKGNSEDKYTLRVTAVSYTQHEEKEPNDSMNFANQIVDGETISGYFSPSRNRNNENQANAFREEDWFRTEIIATEESPVTVDVILSGVNGVDSILCLYDSEMNLLYSADNSGEGAAESIKSFGINKSNSYYIMVATKSYQYNNTEKYSLSLKVNAFDKTSEFEPNNSFETASKIFNNSINGNIHNSGDVDFFMYSAAESYLNIKLIPDKSLDAVLTIFDSSKNKTMEINNKGVGEAEIIPSVYCDGLIYIKVNAVNSVVDAPYEIVIEQMQYDSDIEREPNNSLKDANALHEQISGFSSYKGDRDYYIVKTNGKVRYKINVEAPLNGTIKISTTDQMGYIIKTKTISKGEKYSMRELFDKKGYIIVESVIEDYENPYTIELEEVQ